jgi:hypothetical protein
MGIVTRCQNQPGLDVVLAAALREWLQVDSDFHRDVTCGQVGQKHRRIVPIFEEVSVLGGHP